MMKRMLSIVTIMLVFSTLLLAQELKLPQVSQKTSVMQTVGLTDVTISYSRPGVKGRVIWGGLVPYDKIWRTGANSATIFSVSDDVKINGQNLPAGEYSFHSIPGKDQWTIIFNKVAKQWGSYDYDQSKDALRIQVKPEQGPLQEWMMFSFPVVQPSGATVELAWEKLRVSFNIETNTQAKALANIKQALEGMNNWDIPYGAAQYAFTSNLDNKDEAMKWINQSVALKETYWNLRLKAEMLARDGKTADAIAVAEKAVELGKANKDEPGEVAKTEKQIADWKSKK